MDIKAFYYKHETGIKIFAGLAVIAFIVTVILFGTGDFTVNQ